jgi:trk system potassium uptake protein TrkH
MEGALMALSPLPVIFAGMGMDGGVLPLWRSGVAAVAAIACLICAWTLFRRPVIGKTAGFLALFGCYGGALPHFLTVPRAALLGTVVLIAMGFSLYDFRLQLDDDRKSDHEHRCRQRARYAATAVPVIVVLSMLFAVTAFDFFRMSVAASSLIGQVLLIHWAFQKKTRLFFLMQASGVLCLMLILLAIATGYIVPMALTMSVLNFLLIPRSTRGAENKQSGWELLLNHPARILLSTFFGLCILGTAFLSVPNATTAGAIDLVDAAFTSVSAVCVTGLIVLDTPHDFTGIGQMFILILIQLGGLGIMSITTVALHAMGRRLSLRQERLLTSMTGNDHVELVSSLALILKFTLIAEGLGALALAGLFYSLGDSPAQASWRGLFTAVSAFCNAGFALQSDSLISYQNNPLVLHLIALLIIIGGLAPATSLIVPRWVRGQRISVPARIALVTTVVLLVSGTFFMLAFEWNGMLAGLSLPDKLHNAWFQSVTLRTAGFNSVDIAAVITPTFLIMLCLMFIGGSPGGTAGGIKTTTFGILAMTFMANITNRNVIILQNRRILSATIYRAITIVVAGAFFWFLILLMLTVTQPLSARDLIFEVTSAIGTVGLSTGATGHLDAIGKIIIMIAMFAGRVGPMTLFMLLSGDQSSPVSRCPDVEITLN